jgi:hypothetical protein
MYEKHYMITGEYEVELLYTVLSQHHTGAQEDFSEINTVINKYNNT